MRITKIEKKKRLYLLELDGKESLYITEDTIVRFMLSKDKEITENELQEIRDFAQFSYGKNIALYFLSFKQRTKKEVLDYLKKYEIKEANAVKIITALEEERWIDDKSYVETYVRQNGLNLIEKVAEKLLRKYQDKLPIRALQDKIVQGLMNKGFTYDLARKTVGQLDISADDNMEADLISKELEKLYRKYSRKYDGYELKQRLIQALARRGFEFDQIQAVLRNYL